MISLWGNSYESVYQSSYTVKMLSGSSVHYLNNDLPFTEKVVGKLVNYEKNGYNYV